MDLCDLIKDHSVYVPSHWDVFWRKVTRVVTYKEVWLNWYYTFYGIMLSEVGLTGRIHEWFVVWPSGIHGSNLWPLFITVRQMYIAHSSLSGVYTKFSGRLPEEPFPWLVQKFPCVLIFKNGQPSCQLNLSKGQIRLDLTSGQPLV